MGSEIKTKRRGTDLRSNSTLSKLLFHVVESMCSSLFLIKSLFYMYGTFPMVNSGDSGSLYKVMGGGLCEKR